MRRAIRRPPTRPHAYPVPRLWPGETFVCIASGPSLTAEDVNFVRGKARVIVVNASYALAPWADVLHCADAGPFKWYWAKGPKGYESLTMEAFQGLKFSLTDRSRRFHGVKILGRGPSDGLSLDPRRICLAGNSGYQAINIAVLMGASRILLLGYDMGCGPNNQRHWHAHHPNRNQHTYRTWQRCFPALVEPLKKTGVEVINCSRETRIECFPRMSIHEALPAPAEAAVA